MWSHPAWGAWIEILNILHALHAVISRTPHGVRGLKYGITPLPSWLLGSHPAWGAWIEIHGLYGDLVCRCVAPRMGCVD